MLGKTKGESGGSKVKGKVKDGDNEGVKKREGDNGKGP